MKNCKEMPPILIEKAKGIKLYDQKGNFYYDTISSWWCNVHGHNHPKIKEAIKKQLNSLEQVLFAGFTHKPAILLAEKLVSITPKSLTKVFFSDNGSTAIETALKMSFQYWQNTGKKNKKKFVSLDYGYHGDTIGAMSISGVDLFNEVFSPLFFKSLKVPSPYCYRCPMGRERSSCKIDCVKPLEALLRKKSATIAGIILEPIVMAAGGMIIYPAEYLRKVVVLAKRHKVHLILDEVATGFGRTGKMFACEHASVQPDFICLSKGITSGYLPFAATLTTDQVYRAFLSDRDMRKTFYHGHTYTANPIGCSAALASLKIFEEEKTLERIRKLMPIFHSYMERFRELPIVGDVRYIGMIGAIELSEDKMGERVYREALKEGLILRPLGDIIYLYLPLSIRRAELQTILKRTYKVIENLS